MEKLITAMLYVLWTLTLVGVLMITFTSFRYPDLNIIVILFTLATLVNTYFSLRQKR